MVRDVMDRTLGAVSQALGGAVGCLETLEEIAIRHASLYRSHGRRRAVLHSGIERLSRL
jgi:hypothetical protein